MSVRLRKVLKKQTKDILTTGITRSREGRSWRRIVRVSVLSDGVSEEFSFSRRGDGKDDIGSEKGTMRRKKMLKAVFWRVGKF